MNFTTDPTEMARGLRAMAWGGKVDPDLAAKLQMLPGVDADAITQGAEILLAYRDKLDDDGLALMGSIYSYGMTYWSTFNQGDRSQRIVALVRRDLGATGANVAKKSDEWPDSDIVTASPATGPALSAG